MPATDQVIAAISRLQADYWARVDYLDDAPAEDLFTPDCVFELGSLVLQGRPQLSEFFRKRKQASMASERRTRHLSANLRVLHVEELRVTVTTTVWVMTGYGPLPIASQLPSIGDFEDVCVLAADNRWLFERRKATSVFAGPDAPPFARGGEQ